LVKGELIETKNDGSFRDIVMSSIVFNALKEQLKVTKKTSEYVFCVSNGNPLDRDNFRNWVWYPLLRYLELDKRTLYTIRHIGATIFLVAGESPKFIARQMGHTSTEMLFKVYSRFVPNLTRNDGGAMERLIRSQVNLDK